ncbi:hypothetical protein [Massilia sp. S19_KUP03_FR1]|uniref:hypothetical protein n=1 Tax=Massilia sp. S19_KUP03_FR1 TaxID=3025503 RepID=UPI002FCDB310
METIQDSARNDAGDADPALAVSVAPARARHNLPPKGSCWYCEKPLDNVRRFCGKECADGFDDEAAFSGQNMPA